jgi:hypothetical protein
MIDGQTTNWDPRSVNEGGPTVLPKRIVINLRPAEAEALRVLSYREDRHPKDQAARLLREGLRDKGVLPDAPNIEVAQRELVAAQ